MYQAYQSKSLPTLRHLTTITEKRNRQECVTLTPRPLFPSPAVDLQVGGGKSSLLAALAGELVPLEGRCETEPGARVGYVPQTPWVMSGTLRDNVLLGQPLDAQHYQEVDRVLSLPLVRCSFARKCDLLTRILEIASPHSQVLSASALLPDLSALPSGDLTSVGDRGSALSGGQRARLALARTLYQVRGGIGVAPSPREPSSDLVATLGHSLTICARLPRPLSRPQRCDLYLLDDVLAAVDNASAAHIVDAVMRRPGALGPTIPPSAPTAPRQETSSTVVIVTKSDRWAGFPLLISSFSAFSPECSPECSPDCSQKCSPTSKRAAHVHDLQVFVSRHVNHSAVICYHSLAPFGTSLDYNTHTSLFNGM